MLSMPKNLVSLSLKDLSSIHCTVEHIKHLPDMTNYSK